MMNFPRELLFTRRAVAVEQLILIHRLGLSQSHTESLRSLKNFARVRGK